MSGTDMGYAATRWGAAFCCLAVGKTLLSDVRYWHSVWSYRPCDNWYSHGGSVLSHYALAMRCPVLAWHMILSANAVSGTDIASGATRASMGRSGYAPTAATPCELRWCPTRLLCDVRN
eukprot:1563069-Rhodomonas_salina.1